MDLLLVDASSDHVLQCVRWCIENGETTALVEHLKLHKDKIKDELIPLLLNAFSASNTRVIKVLLNSLDIETIESEGGNFWPNKFLCSAVETGDVGLVKNLIDKGADVNCTFHGKPILHLAANYGYSDIVAELVKAGSDILSTDRYGDGIIHSILTSQLNNKGEIVRQVISQGANPLALSSSGKLPIHLAAKQAPDVLVQLIRDGQDVNCPDDINKETPLHIACGTACRDTILTLIQYGSRFNIENKYGQTPLAKLLRFTSNENDFHSKTRQAIAKMLISIGFRMNCQNTCNSYCKGRDKCYDRYVTLKLSLRTPQTLQSLSRFVVRESLTSSSSLKTTLDKLDIPKNLKSFIMFHDLKL